MSLYEEYPTRIYNVYCRSDDGCIGTFKNLNAILDVHPDIIDYWMNYRVEEVWNDEVVRLWRPKVVERVDWEII
jgi:hypothetical protein